ncbi:MAG: ATP-binding protein [Proteobacteria bacterium]|nr:ATP-binding protein [Pseudomonadota bacterium]
MKELEIWLDRAPQYSQIYYWRTHGGVEVDFIAEKAPRIFPFEVTYSKKIDAKKYKNLKVFLNNLPSKTAGFFIYNGDFHYDSDRNIFFIPLWAVG